MAINVGKTGLRNNKMIFAAIGILVVLVFAGALTLLQDINTEKTYYVLDQPVPADSVIDPMMLRAVSSSAPPPNAIDQTYAPLVNFDLYARVNLSVDDVLTESNTYAGVLDYESAVPDSWVITNFAINNENAVGGFRAGDYFDMMVTTSDGSYYPFVNVLVLKSTASVANLPADSSDEGAELVVSETTQYVIGMPPSEAAVLKTILKNNGTDISLLKSPRQNEYMTPQLAQYSGLFSFDGTTRDIGSSTSTAFDTDKNQRCEETGIPMILDTNCSTDSEGNSTSKEVNDPEAANTFPKTESTDLTDDVMAQTDSEGETTPSTEAETVPAP